MTLEQLKKEVLNDWIRGLVINANYKSIDQVPQIKTCLKNAAILCFFKSISSNTGFFNNGGLVHNNLDSEQFGIRFNKLLKLYNASVKPKKNFQPQQHNNLYQRVLQPVILLCPKCDSFLMRDECNVCKERANQWKNQKEFESGTGGGKKATRTRENDDSIPTPKKILDDVLSTKISCRDDFYYIGLIKYYCNPYDEDRGLPKRRFYLGIPGYIYFHHTLVKNAMEKYGDGAIECINSILTEITED
jgi:hypothetical protein